MIKKITIELDENHQAMFKALSRNGTISDQTIVCRSIAATFTTLLMSPEDNKVLVEVFKKYTKASPGN